jgi:hypothetical protein
MWIELAILTAIFFLGNIFFGHFEAQTPKWRRITKGLVVSAIAIVIGKRFGPVGFYVFLGVLSTLVLMIHGWWLPKNGINGWTAEPKDKYYALRGWKLPH